MRIVVDTNVFVSAVLKINSLPFFVVRWIDRHGGTHYDKPAKVAAQCSLRSPR
jgi:hypothetical protein